MYSVLQHDTLQFDCLRLTFSLFIRILSDQKKKLLKCYQIANFLFEQEIQSSSTFKVQIQLIRLNIEDWQFFLRFALFGETKINHTLADISGRERGHVTSSGRKLA